MTDKPATKKAMKTRKPQKITSPRLANAIYELMGATELTTDSTIQDLIDELRDTHFKEARGQ